MTSTILFPSEYMNINKVDADLRREYEAPYTPGPPAWLVDKYRDLDSPYFTIDYAEIEDGTWKIIETGDGGVSGLSEGQDYEAYFRNVFNALN